MELTYPIHFIGLKDGATSGDVLTRHGEYLGIWAFIEDESNESGLFQFTVHGESEPLFSEHIGVLDSGMLTGLAMSNLCSSIREWHEGQDQS